MKYLSKQPQARPEQFREVDVAAFVTFYQRNRRTLERHTNTIEGDGVFELLDTRVNAVVAYHPITRDGETRRYFIRKGWK
jgi:hypothetical protein